ncbi:MAG: ATP-binding protein [Bacteriovoracaceae bacterium]
MDSLKIGKNSNIGDINKKVNVPLKFKFIVVYSSLIFSTVLLYLYFAFNFYIEDKTAYVFERGLSEAESIFDEYKVYSQKLYQQIASLSLLSKEEIARRKALFQTQEDLFSYHQGSVVDGKLKINFNSFHDDLIKEIEAKNYKVNFKNALGFQLEKFITLKDQAAVLKPAQALTGFPSLVMALKPQDGSGKVFIGILSLINLQKRLLKKKNFYIGMYDYEGKPLFENQSIPENILKKILNENHSNGSFGAEGVFSKKEDLVSFIKDKTLNLTVIISTPKEVAYGAARKLLIESFSFSAILIGASIFISILFAWGVTRPLRNLLEGTVGVINGDFEQKIDVKSNDEIGILTNSFNLMTAEINDLIKNKQFVIDELVEAKTQIMEYNKNLETIVESRTKRLSEANSFLDAIVNSIDEGILVVKPDGTCHEFYTKVCEDFFPVVPREQRLIDVLKIDDPTEQKTLESWIDNIFSETISFEEMAELGPSHYSEGTLGENQFKQISLRYFPIRDGNRDIIYLVVVATNETRRVTQDAAFKRQQEDVDMIIKILEARENFLTFIKESKQFLNQMISDVERGSIDKNSILIGLHSLKGTCSIFAIHSLIRSLHEAEDKMKLADSSENQQRYVYGILNDVQIEFSALLNYASKIIGINLHEGEEIVRLDKSLVVDFAQKVEGAQNQELHKEYLENFVYYSGKVLFKGYEILIQDLSKKLGKKISPLIVNNEDIPIPPEFEEFFSSLIHLFRNVVDHGIEYPSERIQANKTEFGKVKVELKYFYSENEKQEFLNVSIQDDGKGIDPEQIRQKAIEKNIQEVAGLSDESIIYGIFHPEISTSSKVTTVSGRGVGMAAIKKTVDAYHGEIHMKSIKGVGTNFLFKLPVNRPYRS